MSRPAPPALAVRVDRLPREGRDVAIAADAEQRARIAAALDLPAVELFEAEIVVAPLSGRRYQAAGGVRARVVQTCVATGETFAADVEAPIDALFADPDALEKPTAKEVERDLDDEDPPEPVADGAIDVYALAVEFLALTLDPYPRKPGAAFSSAAEADPPEPEHPFAKLAALKRPSA